MRRQAGFTLVETVCVLAIVALLAGLILPSIPRGTSRARLEGYTLQTASLLMGDRDAAIRRRRKVETHLDDAEHAISSGANGRILRFPRDLELSAQLVRICDGRPAGQAITFFPNGVSCGGVVKLRRGATAYEIRVNWLTGLVEVVPAQ